MKVDVNLLDNVIDTNLELKKGVEVSEKERELLYFLVQYTGNKLDPQREEVTSEMIIEILAKEVPEIIALIAEENFVRGYKQACVDMDAMEKTMNKSKIGLETFSKEEDEKVSSE